MALCAKVCGYFLSFVCMCWPYYYNYAAVSPTVGRTQHIVLDVRLRTTGTYVCVPVDTMHGCDPGGLQATVSEA